MSKKQSLTNAEIEKDIIGALKNPPGVSEKSNRKWTIPAAVIAIALIVPTTINPKIGCLICLAVLALLIIVGVSYKLRTHYRVKNVSICDYNITHEVVHSISEEHYKADTGGKRRRIEQIDNYIVHFESGKEWRIPKQNYVWHERLRASDRGVYETTHRGDTMLIATDKRTDKIVMAYNTEIFEYKN